MSHRYFPFVLSAGRVVYHSHTRTKTGRSAALNGRAPHAYCEIHPDDAARLGIALGDRVEVTSVHSRWEGPAMVVDTVRPGELLKSTFGTPEPWLLARYAELAGQSIDPYAARTIGGTIMTTP